MASSQLIRCLALLAPLGCATTTGNLSASELRARCAAEGVPCRANTRIALRRVDGSRFETTLSVAPAPLQEGAVVTVYPGETVYIEAEAVGNAIQLRRAVKTPEHPERTITLRLSQDEGGPGTVLRVKNPFGRLIKYDLGIMMLDSPAGNRLLKTSACPVVAEGEGFESWPYPIFQVAAVRFRFVLPGYLSCD